MEPLALLVHPQQPLSYLERLIQSELPSIRNGKGEEKVPAVHFRAEDSQQDAIEPTEKKADETPEDLYEDAEGEMEETKFEGRTEKTGKLGKNTKNTTQLGEGGVESYSGLGHEGPSVADRSRKFVRWSSSTEVGDFIRDAARGKEFAVEVEGAPEEIRVGVPSFNDRTHYLRLRLRKTASKIIDLAAVKKECDLQAHKGAQRVAMGGAAVLVGYWYVVYRLTFETDLGWDTMEPVTVSTLILRVTPDSNQAQVPCRPFHPHLWLSLVPLPQPRGILPLSTQPHHQSPANEAVSAERLRYPKVGQSDRRGEWLPKRGQADSE